MGNVSVKSPQRVHAAKPKQTSVGELDVATVAEAIPHIVWMTDSSGFGDYLNSSALELTGLGAEALSGSGWLEAVHPGDTMVVTSLTKTKRLSTSRPNMGIITWHTVGRNQRDEIVVEFDRSNFVAFGNAGSGE